MDATETVMAPEATAADAPRKVRGWDPLVKLTHWGIALAVLANGVLTEEGSDWHVWVGTAMAGLLAARLLWGFVGPREARFSAFPPNPFRAFSHIGDILAGRKVVHRSHNPLGALMAYSLWATLGVVAVTGFLMSGVPGITAAGTAERPAMAAPLALAAPAEEEEEDEDEAAEGAYRASEGADGAAEGAEGKDRGEADEWVEEVHEVAANLLFVLAALHIAGVLFETRRMGRGVIGRMTGGMRG